MQSSFLGVGVCVFGGFRFFEGVVGIFLFFFFIWGVVMFFCWFCLVWVLVHPHSHHPDH